MDFPATPFRMSTAGFQLGTESVGVWQNASLSPHAAMASAIANNVPKIASIRGSTLQVFVFTVAGG